MSETFISYSRADSAFVDKLRRDLEQRGIPVWIDRESIEGGAAWRASISQAIRSCCAFILVLSPRSTQSGQVSKELSVAESHGRLIVPVVVEASEIPPGMELQLAELQWISFAEQPYDDALARLTRVLNEARSRTAGVSPAPAKVVSQSPPPAAARVASPPRAPSVTPSRAALSGSSRKWLLAGGAAVLVAGASLAAFEFLNEPGATSVTQNVAGIDGKSPSAEAGAIVNARVPAVAVPSDATIKVIPVVPHATGDAPPAEPRTSQSATVIAEGPASDAPSAADAPAARTETRSATPSAPSVSAPPVKQPPEKSAAAPRKDPPAEKPAVAARKDSPAEKPAVDARKNAPPEKPVVIARVDPAPEKSATASPADTAAAQASGPIVGNTRTKFYHFPGCPNYTTISPQARIEFASARDAEGAGYKLSVNCADPGGGRPAPGVLANSRTKEYFLPHCRGYAATNPQYRMPFSSIGEAEQAGYKRSDKCT